MEHKIVRAFNEFIKTTDDEISTLVTSGSTRLTSDILDIHSPLWYNYKAIGGTSAGFYGIDEYILFSAFKCFAESLNAPQKFECRILNRDRRSFELKRDAKSLEIYHAASLKLLPVEAQKSLFINKKKYPAPDLAILKKEGEIFRLVAVIEMKNFLDKGGLEGGLKMLSEIREITIDDNTKYALFSFGPVSVHNDEILNKLKNYQNQKNNYLITNEKKNSNIRAIDLSEFFEIIKIDLSI